MSECNDDTRLLDGLNFIESSSDELEASFNIFKHLILALLHEKPYNGAGALIILDEGEFFTVHLAVKPATFDSSYEMYKYLLDEFSDEPGGSGWNGVAVHFGFFASPEAQSIVIYSINLSGVGIINLHIDCGWHKFDAHPPMLEQLIFYSKGIDIVETKSGLHSINHVQLARKYADNLTISAAISEIQKAIGFDRSGPTSI